MNGAHVPPMGAGGEGQAWPAGGVPSFDDLLGGDWEGAAGGASDGATDLASWRTSMPSSPAFNHLPRPPAPAPVAALSLAPLVADANMGSPTDSCNFDQYLDIPPSATAAQHPISAGEPSERDGAPVAPARDSPAAAAPSSDASDSSSSSASSAPATRPAPRPPTLAERQHKRRARPSLPALPPPAVPTVTSTAHFHTLVLSLTARYYRDLAGLVQSTAPEVIGALDAEPDDAPFRTVMGSVKYMVEQLVPTAPDVQAYEPDVPDSTDDDDDVSSTASSAAPLTPTLAAASLPRPAPVRAPRPAPVPAPRPAAAPVPMPAPAPGRDATHLQLATHNGGRLAEARPEHTGPWTAAEEATLRQLAAQSATVTGGEPDWTWVAQRFGPGRNRRQLKLKATALGLKRESGRRNMVTQVSRAVAGLTASFKQEATADRGEAVR